MQDKDKLCNFYGNCIATKDDDMFEDIIQTVMPCTEEDATNYKCPIYTKLKNT